MKVLLLATVGLIQLVAAASCGGGGSCESPLEDCYNRELRIHIPDGSPPYNYIDESNGRLRGLFVDVVRAACNAEGLRCRLIWGPAQDCFTVTPAGDNVVGEGIYNGKADLYDDEDIAAQAFLDGEVPTLFVPETFFASRSRNQFPELQSNIGCTLAGDSLASMKGNCGVNVLNRGLSKVFDSGLYDELCSTASKRYLFGENIQCIR